MNKHSPTGKRKRRPSLTLPADPSSVWLRLRSVANRYNVSKRTVPRLVEAQRLPPPEFPLGNDLPMWHRRVLDEHDAAATKQSVTA